MSAAVIRASAPLRLCAPAPRRSDASARHLLSTRRTHSILPYTLTVFFTATWLNVDLILFTFYYFQEYDIYVRTLLGICARHLRCHIHSWPFRLRLIASSQFIYLGALLLHSTLVTTRPNTLRLSHLAQYRLRLQPRQIFGCMLRKSFYARDFGRSRACHIFPKSVWNLRSLERIYG